MDGPVYFDAAGRAWPVTLAERDGWRRDAEAHADAYASWLEQGMIHVGVLAVLLIGAWSLVNGLIPGGEDVPVYFAGLPAVGLPLVRELRYRREREAWRGRIEEALRQAGRAPVWQAPRPARNLYALGRNVLVWSVLLLVGWAALKGSSGAEFMPIVLPMIPLIYALHWCANRADDEALGTLDAPARRNRNFG